MCVLRCHNSQVWDTFPAFCNLPVDVVEVFAPMARKLGEHGAIAIARLLDCCLLVCMDFSLAL